MTKSTFTKCAHPQCPGYPWPLGFMAHPSDPCGTREQQGLPPIPTEPVSAEREKPQEPPP